MPLTDDDIVKYRKRATESTAGHIEATSEQAARSRTTFLPGDRVFADRAVKPGHGTVICSHTTSSYVAVTIELDEHGRACVEASRVKRSNVPAPSAVQTKASRARKARRDAKASE